MVIDWNQYPGLLPTLNDIEMISSSPGTIGDLFDQLNANYERQPISNAKATISSPFLSFSPLYELETHPPTQMEEGITLHDSEHYTTMNTSLPTMIPYPSSTSNSPPPSLPPSTDVPSAPAFGSSGCGDSDTEMEVDVGDVSREIKSGSSKTWAPFASNTAANGSMIKEIFVQQLPLPRDQEERKEQRAEWESSNLHSEEEATKIYQRLARINRDRLRSHHNHFPTFDIFKLHLPHLPRWLIEGKRPKWRSLLDEEVNTGLIKKLHRYIYGWRTVASIEDARVIHEEMRSERWEKLAKDYGCINSYREAVLGIGRVIQTAELDGSKSVSLGEYVGLGAESELSVNETCRAFHHLGRPHSLFGVVLEVLRFLRSTKQSTSFRLIQTFLTALPVSIFPHSNLVFTFAETIFAVAMEAAPMRGGVNVLACGKVSFFADLQIYLQQFSNSTRLDSPHFLSTDPLSLQCIVRDRATRKGYTTVGEMRSVLKPDWEKAIKKEEGEEGQEITDKQSPETRRIVAARLEAIQRQEETLRSSDEALLNRPLTTSSVPHRIPPSTSGDPVSSDSEAHPSVPAVSSRPTPLPSSSSSSTRPKLPRSTSTSTSIRSNDAHLDKLEELYGFSSASALELDRIMGSKRMEALVPRMKQYHQQLDLYRDIAKMMVHRAETRGLENIFDNESLRSKVGNPFFGAISSETRHESTRHLLHLLGPAILPDGSVTQLDSKLMVPFEPVDIRQHFR